MAYTPKATDHVYDFDVDFIRRNVPHIQRLVQYDAGMPVMALHIFKNGLVYRLPSTGQDYIEDITVRFKRSDGVVFIKELLGTNADRSILYIGVDEDMSGVAGIADVVVELIDNHGNVAHSAVFKMEFEKNPVQEDDVQGLVNRAALAPPTVAGSYILTVVVDDDGKPNYRWVEVPEGDDDNGYQPV